MSKITFTSSFSKLKLDKTKLKPNADGYYKVSLGAINVYNSAGDFYEYTEEVAKLFGASSTLMTRLDAGALRSENGHPKMLPGMSKNDFIRRICTIEETLVCGHIKEVSIEMTNKTEKDANAPIVMVTGLIRPEGTHGEALKSSLENPDSNSALSIRSLTKNRMVGNTMVKTLIHIATWDFVIMPGISIANKANWASLESEDLLDFDDSELDDLTSSIENLKSEISVESEKLSLDEMLSAINSCKEDGKSCIYKHWK